MLVAVRNGHVEIAKLLIEHGVDFNIRYELRKRHLIHIAARANQVEMVRFLLDLDPSLVDVFDIYRQTPIYLATDIGKEEVVRCLIAANANLDCRLYRPGAVDHNTTLWDRAEQYPPIKKLLVEAKTNNSVLATPKSAQNTSSNEENSQETLEFDDIHALYFRGQSPIEFARLYEQEVCLNILQEAYLQQFLAQFPKERPGDCLEKAVVYGHSKIVYFLFDNGGVLDSRLFRLAVKHGHLDLVQDFISRNPSLLTNHALIVAAEEGQDALVEYLLKQSKLQLSLFSAEENKKILDLIENSEHHRTTSRLILALTQNDKAAIPGLIYHAEQALQLIDLDPSLLNLLLEDKRVQAFFEKENIQKNLSYNAEGQTLGLYKPANKRQSIYLRSIQTLSSGNHAVTLFKPEKELANTGNSLIRQFSSKEKESIVVKSFINDKKVNSDRRKKEEKSKVKQEICFTQQVNGADGLHCSVHFFSQNLYNFRFVQPFYQGLEGDYFLQKIKDPHKLAEVIFLIAQELLKEHEKNIVHGDFKHRNILIDEEYRVKIIDHGFSAVKNTKRPTIPITEHPLYHSWHPPECLGKASIAHPNQDVYSLGVLLHDSLLEHSAKEELLHHYPSIGEFMEKARSIVPKERPKLSGFCELLFKELTEAKELSSLNLDIK